MTEVLYMLVRSKRDLDSLNPGKGMAQTGHVGSAFTHEFYVEPLLKGETPDEDVVAWHAQGKGFGTKLTLEVTGKEMAAVVSTAKLLGYKVGVVNDETYPYIVPNETASLIPLERDTAPRHPVSDTHMALYRSENTVGYVFVPNKEEDETTAALLRNFRLHP